MIEWYLDVFYDGSEDRYDLALDRETRISIRETSNIRFLVSIEDADFHKFGIPYVVISDIPIEFKFSHYNGEYRVFESVDSIESHSSRYFYNFFGESEVNLFFERESNTYSSHKVNILARQANAELASEMLNHITSNLDDAISICFSRSKLSVDFDDSKSFNFSRLEIIQNAITYLSETLPTFLREHKYSWKPEMEISERGQPTGPDSVHWVFNNLDKLSPASIDDANLVYNNRGYRLDALPKESIVKESDVYENQVLHTFLHNITLFLIEIKEQYTIDTLENDDDAVDLEYVRFDHTMRKYTQMALTHKINQIDSLIIAIEQIKRVFKSKLPASLVLGIQPRVTSYVARHPHYRNTFELIEKCYKAPSPSFEGANLLLGLKNLSIVYETSSLILLHESIKKCFLVDLTEQSYRKHAEYHPFGGIQKERPQGEVNNYFRFESRLFSVELFYEPKIYPFSKNSSVGDLVDTSNSKRNEYGLHYFCPDFVLKIQSQQWSKPATIILDAKYKDASTIRLHDIDALTKKYLLNIHQVNTNGRLGVSPVNLLLLLFPHSRSGKVVRTVSRQHCLDGEYPLLPQSSAILVKPTEAALLDEHLSSFVDVMNEEEKIIAADL
ncbi:hypothetical protein A0J47_014185 [Photobacterium damselae subsp. damselae]|uniref:nuclease domain-containing protein n=1 Tax=Photobacterium damselae TaxID=38293 RepID=UPI00083AA454|nr:nuclease domain-containing protein [Photobacterium damselae]QSH57030.1 hypothetical protein A0J47_014185 [Photobacterium damselae subsp. damselae]